MGAGDAQNGRAVAADEMHRMLADGSRFVDRNGFVAAPDAPGSKRVEAGSIGALVDRNRLAQLREVEVNWCPMLGTVLANEEVVDGKSERGGHPVVRMPLRQWLLRITDYAERLLDDLELVPELEDAQIRVVPYGFDAQPGPMGRITHRIEVSGGDQLGLIARLAEIFAQNGANIVRLDAQKLSEMEGGRYVTRFSVWLPAERAASRWIVSTDPDEQVERIRPYVEMGFRHLVFHAPGTDQMRFLKLYSERVLPRLRKAFG